MPKIEQKKIPNDVSVEFAGRTMTQACHNNAWNAGWWHDINTGEVKERNVPEALCLIHSEVSEALEGFRKGVYDDHLTDRPMLEVELADAVIRIFDLAGGMKLDVAGAIAEKLEYNRKRADHKVENRKKDGGKKV